jgi:L-galactose dehydrogenase
MEFTTLGRTEIRVSRMGLGCGGHSRLGQATGSSKDESVRIVREAIDLGVNFIDTAEAYGTEEIVGEALRDIPRERVIISTKIGVQVDGKKSTPEEFRHRAEGCLARLQVEYLDILHVHGLTVQDYPYAAEVLMPVLQELRSQGKIGFLGVTEAFAPDPGHGMLALASKDDFWDVIMIGFNVLNQSARERALPWTMAKNVGTLGMFAVRRALSNPERLRELVREMTEKGMLKESEVDLNNPLGFVVADGVATSVTEAAYRFCLWEPGIDVVLSGTGNLDHLRENAKYLSQPPLPPEISERLRRLFAGIDSVSGN